MAWGFWHGNFHRQRPNSKATASERHPSKCASPPGGLFFAAQWDLISAIDFYTIKTWSWISLVAFCVLFAVDRAVQKDCASAV